MIVDERNVTGGHVTRGVAQSPVLFSTTRGNMNNIFSCLVKSTYVAFLVLIVNDHSLHRTRLLRVTGASFSGKKTVIVLFSSLPIQVA